MASCEYFQPKHKLVIAREKDFQAKHKLVIAREKDFQAKGKSVIARERFVLATRMDFMRKRDHVME